MPVVAEMGQHSVRLSASEIEIAIGIGIAIEKEGKSMNLGYERKAIKIGYPVLLMAAAAFAAVCCAAPASGSLMSNLEAYYAFDLQNGDDGSGNALNVTLFGGVAFEPGLMGYALAPNGNNAQYAARTIDDPSLNFGTGDFTLQAWVKYNTTVGEQILLEKFSGATGPGWTFTKLSDNRFAFANDPGSTPVVVSGVQTIPANLWHHLLIRRTSGTYELFYNNVSIATVTSASGSISTAPLLIGRRNAADGRDFSLKGSIDEIAIWSRSLSYGEIESLYNDGQGLAITKPKVTITGINISEGNAILQWQGDRANLVYMVEFCTNLSAAVWSPVTPISQWWMSETIWTNQGLVESEVFFRIKAKEP